MAKYKKARNDFYKELDLSKQKKGSCGCLTLSIIFALIFLLVEISVFLFFKNIRVSPNTELASLPVSSQNLQFSKIGLANNEMRIVIAQGLLCSKIIAQNDKLPKNLSCLIDKSGIKLSGKFSLLVPANSQVTIMPKVQSEKLVFDVTELTFGKIHAPVFLSSGLGKILTDVIYKEIPDLNNASVQSVELDEGMMVITAGSPLK